MPLKFQFDRLTLTSVRARGKSDSKTDGQTDTQTDSPKPLFSTFSGLYIPNPVLSRSRFWHDANQSHAFCDFGPPEPGQGQKVGSGLITPGWAYFTQPALPHPAGRPELSGLWVIRGGLSSCGGPQLRSETKLLFRTYIPVLNAVVMNSNVERNNYSPNRTCEVHRPLLRMRNSIFSDTVCSNSGAFRYS